MTRHTTKFWMVGALTDLRGYGRKIKTKSNVMIQRLFQSKTAPDVNAETRKQPRHVSYSRFARGLKAGELDQIVIKPNSSLAAALTKEGDVIDAQVVSNPELWKLLTHTDADVSIDVSAPPNALETASLVMTLLFTFIMIRSFGSLFFRGKGDSGAGGMNPFAQFNDQVFEIDADVSTRLEDVEGIDNAKRELEEIVDFLKNPELFTANGAKIPNGAILTGLPGCGKTLLARAIAGEANVPFITVRVCIRRNVRGCRGAGTSTVCLGP